MEGNIAIIVALIGIVPSVLTLIVTTIINKKVKRQNDLREEMNKSLNDLRKDFRIKTNTMELRSIKRFLVNEFTEIENGIEKNEEQKAIIHESFKIYENLGRKRIYTLNV